MDITPLLRPEHKLVQSYGVGFFKVNGVVWNHPIFITADTIIPWVISGSALELPADIKSLLSGIDICLIGMGTHYSIIPPSKRKALADISTFCDIMDTPSACRTYNVLTSEGRRVAAALIPVV